MSGLVIFDKNWTLIRPVQNRHVYVEHAKDQQLMTGVAEAIAVLTANHISIAVITNMGGVAAGKMSRDDAIAQLRYLKQLIPEIKAAYFTPDFKGKQIVRLADPTQFVPDFTDLSRAYDIMGPFRKPAPGMIRLAKRDFQTSDVVMVGDRIEDQMAAHYAGVPYVPAELFRSGIDLLQYFPRMSA